MQPDYRLDAVRGSDNDAPVFVKGALWRALTEAARLNGGALTVPAGSYRVSVLGIRAGPFALRLENGQRLELSLDDAGKLTMPTAK